MGVILWLSDLHLDPFYGTNLASSHKVGNNCSLPDNATLLEHPYGRVGCDSPPSLLEFALANAENNAGKSKNSRPTIDFILITGDFARHSMDTLSDNLGDSKYDPVGSILSTCIQSIQNALPDVPIVPVIGNNDVVPDYYLGLDTFESDPELPNPEIMLETITSGLKDAFLTQDESSTFQHGGYFSRLVDLPSSTSSILVLSLNTVLYSVNHQPDLESQDTNGNAYRPEDPYGQFEWMRSQLQMAANHTGKTNTIVGVYLAGHIPPSIGSYRHSQLWHDQYLEEFFTILQDYSNGKCNPTNHNNESIDNTNSSSDTIISPPPILGHFYGHVHTEEFRLLTHDLFSGHRHATNKTAHETNTTDSTKTTTNQQLSIPVLVTSSITPIYGSNPSYRLVEYDDQSGNLLDYTTHYFNLDSAIKNNNLDDLWIELPSFVDAYGVPDLSVESFQSLMERLERGLEETIDFECGKRNVSSSEFHLWETFWNRQDLYSSSPDDADDNGSEMSPVSVMTDWLCTFQASTKRDYETCLDKKRTELSDGAHICGEPSGSDVGSSNNSGNAVSVFSVFDDNRLGVSIITACVFVLSGVFLALWFSKKRCSKRKMYSMPHGDGDEDCPSRDGVFVVGDDDEDHIEITTHAELTMNENGELA